MDTNGLKNMFRRSAPVLAAAIAANIVAARVVSGITEESSQIEKTIAGSVAIITGVGAALVAYTATDALLTEKAETWPKVQSEHQAIS